MQKLNRVRRAVVFDAKTTTGIGEQILIKGDTGLNWSAKDYIPSKGFNDSLVTISASAGTTAVVKCIGAKFVADTETPPNLKSASDVGNEWGYIRMYDLDVEDGSDGSDGVEFVGGGVKQFTINAGMLDIINFEISSISGGAITLSISLAQNV